MNKNSIKLTTAQFAKLHNVNKRTLHYYDSIGLFSPNSKGENGYRYYDLSQSMDFEYILMLKELNMSIEEITKYMKNPTPEKFIALANIKEEEIDQHIRKLTYIKKIIQKKKNQIELCKTINNSQVKLIKCKKEKLNFLPYDFSEDDISTLFSHIKTLWNIEEIRMGVGGVISVEKVINNDFTKYDGIYTPALKNTPKENIFYKPEGDYICYYHKGTWDALPQAYQKMLSFAKENNLICTGYAYEIGMNEFAISKEEDYITKIMIKVEERP